MDKLILTLLFLSVTLNLIQYAHNRLLRNYIKEFNKAQEEMKQHKSNVSKIKLLIKSII